MRIIHAFHEEKGAARKKHIRTFFGIAPGDDEDYQEDGSYVICYCGARLVPLEYRDGDVSVAGVWHNYKPMLIEDGE